MSNIGQSSIGYNNANAQIANMAKQPQPTHIGPMAYDIRAIKAEGGWIISTRNAEQLGQLEKYYVVAEDADLGEAISKILMKEALTR